MPVGTATAFPLSLVWRSLRGRRARVKGPTASENRSSQANTTTSFVALHPVKRLRDQGAVFPHKLQHI